MLITIKLIIFHLVSFSYLQNRPRMFQCRESNSKLYKLKKSMSKGFSDIQNALIEILKQLSTCLEHLPTLFMFLLNNIHLSSCFNTQLIYTFTSCFSAPSHGRSDVFCSEFWRQTILTINHYCHGPIKYIQLSTLQLICLRSMLSRNVTRSCRYLLNLEFRIYL